MIPANASLGKALQHGDIIQLHSRRDPRPTSSNRRGCSPNAIRPIGVDRHLVPGGVEPAGPLSATATTRASRQPRSGPRLRALRVVAVADKGSGRFDTAGAEAAVTPIGRMAFGGDILDCSRTSAGDSRRERSWMTFPCCNAWPSARHCLAIISPARFFDVGVPEGYREAVAASPARA